MAYGHEFHLALDINVPIQWPLKDMSSARKPDKIVILLYRSVYYINILDIMDLDVLGQILILCTAEAGNKPIMTICKDLANNAL